MVLVNGKKFKIYDLDDISTFKDRLASKYSTLPEYLYFPNDLSYSDLSGESNIIFEDIFEYIKKSAKDNTSIKDVIDLIKSKLGKNFKIKDKVVPVWFLYNKKLNDDYETKDAIAVELIADELVKMKIFFTKNQVIRVLKDIKIHEEKIKNTLENHKNNVDQKTKLFEEFDNIKEPIVSTEFKVEDINFILTLNLKNISILELFNSIVLTDNVPFATTHNFYKLLLDYVPPDDWVKISEDSIILKVNKKDYITKSSKSSNYLDAVININNSGNVTVEITIKNEKGNVQKDKFIRRLLTVFNKINISIENIKESKVVGTFYFPQQNFDKYIFSDLVMNDDIFKILTNIDDHEFATTKKSGIYIHFEHPKTGYVTATITEKIMKKDDQSMKGENHYIFPIGESYIRVRISKSNNIKAVEHFKIMLGKLFVRYDQQYNHIKDFYRKYIKDFGVIEVEEVEEKTDLKLTEEVPEIFGAGGFSTYCNKERTPTIISENDAKDLEQKGQSVMKFPRDVPEYSNIIKYPSDGEDQRYYTCNHKKYKYIGLQENNLKNQDIYPFIPCCFIKEQKKKSIYQHYYGGKEPKILDKKQNNIISTDKILKHDQYGTLPPNIENLFNIIDPEINSVYVRRGVGVSEKRNVNSFINAVMEALNDTTGILDIVKEKELEKRLIDQRNKLANEKIVALCRQELYDMSIQEIIDIIKDGNKYFDPKLFIHLLEYTFNCNIVLFTKKTLDGEMTLPRHLQAYYKNKNKKKYVYIFEHTGSKSDIDKSYPWPQCEVIVKYNPKSGDVQDSFTFEESKNVRIVYDRLRKSYSLDKVIDDIDLPIKKDIKILSQFIDSYGKTRQLNIDFKGKQVSLIISPIQPLPVRETTKEKIYLIEKKYAMDLIKKLGMKIQSQTVVRNILKEINGIVGNVSVSIPLTKTKIIKEFNIPIKEYGLSYTEDQKSILEQYNINKKLARYLVEYTLWIYSKYLNTNNILDITDKNITEFAQDFFEIIPNFEYGYISKNLSESSPFLQKGKIVVHSEETKKRLIYVLRLNIQRNKYNVLNYHKKTIIENYYVDLTDFDKYNHQIILFGEESVDKWISENNVRYFLYDKVQIGINTPYFFKNKLINNNLYLAQNTTSLSKATNIGLTWEKNGYNPGIHAYESQPLPFPLYAYQNSNSIKELKIKDKKFSKIKILGYKIDNIPFYTTLLPLS